MIASSSSSRIKFVTRKRYFKESWNGSYPVVSSRGFDDSEAERMQPGYSGSVKSCNFVHIMFTLVSRVSMIMNLKGIALHLIFDPQGKVI